MTAPSSFMSLARTSPSESKPERGCGLLRALWGGVGKGDVVLSGGAKGVVLSPAAVDHLYLHGVPFKGGQQIALVDGGAIPKDGDGAV